MLKSKWHHNSRCSTSRAHLVIVYLLHILKHVAPNGLGLFHLLSGGQACMVKAAWLIADL
jgi:hypothetical protein